MLSRGQIMVKLANKKTKSVNQPVQMHLKIQGPNVKTIVDELDSNNNIFSSVSIERSNENVNKGTIHMNNHFVNASENFESGVLNAENIENYERVPDVILQKDFEIEYDSNNISSDVTLTEIGAGVSSENFSNIVDREEIVFNEASEIQTTIQDIDNSRIDSDFSDFVDYHDVADPDWQPEKRKRDENSTSSSNESEPETRLEQPIELGEGYTPTRQGKQLNINQRNKKLRMQGKQYLGYGKDGRGKKTYCVERAGRLLEPRRCSKRCGKGWGGVKCASINEEDRTNIFGSFWTNMTWGEKKVYVMSLVEKNKVARKVTDNDNSRRKYSYSYFLKVNDSSLKVCKSFFLGTLGLKEDTVYNWLQSTSSGHGIPEMDNEERRMSSTPNRLNARALEFAKEFLRNIPKLPSHYCRADSSKEYLESSFTCISELFKTYKEYAEETQQPVYQITQFTKLFKEMNLSFFKPKKDQCDLCCGHRVGTIEDEVYQNHLRRKNEAACAKASDKEHAQSNEKIKVITMDLQSLLLCPKLQASVLYYRTKLCCYNFTLFDLVSKDVLCYFWNETATDLCASTFASCVVDYLDKIDLEGVEKVIFYSDGCTYQNRNVTLSNALVDFAMKREIIVEQKFLEKGHTYMECDSVHACVERKLKHKDIFVPQQYVDVIEQAKNNQPYTVKYVGYEFFKDYTGLKHYNSIRPGTVVGSPVVTDIRLLRYNIDGTIEYKLNYSDEAYAPIPKPRSSRTPGYDVRQMNSQAISLKKAKYEHLQQIKSVVPKDYHSFYDSLPHHI